MEKDTERRRWEGEPPRRAFLKPGTKKKQQVQALTGEKRKRIKSENGAIVTSWDRRDHQISLGEKDKVCKATLSKRDSRPLTSKAEKTWDGWGGHAGSRNERERILVKYSAAD